MTKFLDMAVDILGVQANNLTSFSAIDPFNDLLLDGYICHVSDHRYGALFITHVERKPIPQLVLATPKFPYPFDREGQFHFPEDVARVEAYEKLDGTNIFGFKYRSWGNRPHVTYKTRLMPVLHEGRFGPFLSYWREMLQQYPEIEQAVMAYPGYGLSFELFGARNKHLLIYDVPLDTRLLFGVRQDGCLEPPSTIPVYPCPAPPFQCAQSTSDLRSIYKAMQAELEAELVTDDVLGGYRGAEGRIWYALSDGRWHAFKCKPETIEAIHWGAGGLGLQVIKATAYNVLENHDSCTPELIRDLLLEEFNQTEIDIAWQVVLRVSAQVNEEVRLRQRIFELYVDTGVDFATDPVVVMRQLSPHFPRNKMRYVYSTLARREMSCSTQS